MSVFYGPDDRPMAFEGAYQAYKAAVDAGLAALPMDGVPSPLLEAMRYSLLSPGKRLRGCVLLAACRMAGGDVQTALPFALAMEMIHAYSLVHDDLPAMDDDTLRRGKPTNHVVYGEGMAILAGDGLLNLAYETMACQPCEGALSALSVIAAAAGCRGMVAGQALDLSLEGASPAPSLTRRIHEGKTASLIAAAAEAGLILAGASKDETAAGRAFGMGLGLAFQIVDDLLDLEGDEAKLGKHTGKDEKAGKLTWPACVGEENARRDAAALIAGAQDALERFKERGDFLKALAQNTLSRVQ